MKRLISIALALMLLWLCGCGGGSAENPMTAEFAKTDMTVDNMFIAEDSEYISYLLFTAHEDLTDVRVYIMEFEEDGFIPAEELYAADGMAKNETLLGGVVFWGDMTTYGVSFTDSTGAAHRYEVSLSGKDGSLIFNETTE